MSREKIKQQDDDAATSNEPSQTQSQQPLRDQLPPPQLPPELDGIVDTLHNEPLAPYKKQKKWKRKLLVFGGLLATFLATIIGAYMWYQSNLQAVEPGSDELVKVEITEGSSSRQIAALLAEEELVRNESAFYWYVRLTGDASLLQSGMYRLSKGDNVPAIVDQLKGGKTDTFSLTFLPGNTIKEHRQVLIDAGYDAVSVDQALAKRYDHPLFAKQPPSADLEGYIYGETYEFAANTTPEDVLTRTFDEMYDYIESQQLIDKFNANDLNLYEAITLASIIQREEPDQRTQQQVAQVFLLRLEIGMPLGSDPTYQYAADKLGISRSPNLDSPYNTRKVKGLPPGPISSPGESALYALSNPASGDYLYFVSGDDNKTYFSRTLEEHERNVQEHCQEKCQIL